MKATVAIPIYNSAFSLVNVVDRMVYGTNAQIVIYLIPTSKHGPTIGAALEAQKKHDQVVVDSNMYCPSVAAAWNEAIVRTYITQNIPTDLLILSNDDIFVSNQDIDKVIAKAEAELTDKTSIITVAGPHMGFRKRLDSHGYSFFALSEACVNAIGAVDENFRPAYLEDCDYSWRWSRLGFTELNVADTEVTHVGSGTAFRASEDEVRMIQRCHQLNHIYYKKKWGGENGKEVYDHPFNDESVGMFISLSTSETPYGERYDRPNVQALEG